MDVVSDCEQEDADVEEVEPRAYSAEMGPVSCSQVTCTEE